MKAMSGGCYCGAIKFMVTAPSLWCAHCHCSICQRIHGSGLVTWIGFSADGVKIIDAGNELDWYESTAGAERGHCRRCHSALFFRSADWPGELHVTLASFESPVDREPAAHVFYATHVDWLQLADELPRKE